MLQHIMRDRVRNLEHRAEELRAIAEYMQSAEVRAIYEELAREYEEMAARRKRMLH